MYVCKFVRGDEEELIDQRQLKYAGGKGFSGAGLQGETADLQSFVIPVRTHPSRMPPYQCAYGSKPLVTPIRGLSVSFKGSFWPVVATKPSTKVEAEILGDQGGTESR